MLVAEGAGRWICWTLFVWGIVTGCPLRGRGWHMGLRVPGGVPFCRQPCTPSVNPRAELRLPGLPRGSHGFCGSVQQWPAPPSTSPSPRFPYLGPGVVLTEAPSRQHEPAAAGGRSGQVAPSLLHPADVVEGSRRLCNVYLFIPMAGRSRVWNHFCLQLGRRDSSGIPWSSWLSGGPAPSWRACGVLGNGGSRPGGTVAAW